MKKIVLLFLFLGCTTAFAQVDVRKNATFFSNGLQSKYREDTDGAIRNFEQALHYMPDDAASMFELCEQYTNAGRVEDAYNMIRQAAALDPENKWYQLRLGQFYRSLEQYDDYIKLYEGLTAKYPDEIEILSDLIDAYLITENYDKALAKMEVLEKQLGQNEVIVEQRLNIYRQLGQTKKLIAELERLVAENPENLRYYNMLAQVYQDNGKDKEALKIFERIREINPSDPYINISLLEFYDRNGDQDKAFDALLAAIRNENLDLTTKSNIYDYWVNQHQSSDQLNEQVRQCGEAFIDIHPDHKLGYLILGSYYMIKEQASESKEQYKRSLAIDSTDFYSWQNLIISESRLNETEAVRDHAVQAMKYYPMQPVFYWYAAVSSAVLNLNDEAISYLEKGRRYTTEKLQMANFDAYLGDLYHQQGDEEKAFEAYDRTLRNDPDNALVLNNYAYYLSLKGERLDEALQMAIKANDLEPENVYYVDTYAWVLYKLGRYKEAEKQMKYCLNLEDHPSGSNLEHYGDILFQLGKKTEALEYWNRAKQAGGYSNELEQKLAH